MWGNLWQNLVEHSEIQVGPPSPPSYSTNFGPLSFSAQKRNRSLFRSLPQSVWSVRREIKIKRRGGKRRERRERRVPPKVDDDGNVGRANSSGKFNLRSKRERGGGREREGHFRIYNVQNTHASRVDWDELGEEETKIRVRRN